MAGDFAPKCLSIDLEVGKTDLRIHQFAAVRGDNGASIRFVRGDLGSALNRLDDLGDEAAFLLGHNLVNFDLPHLKAARPDLRLHSKPAVDTLWLARSLISLAASWLRSASLRTSAATTAKPLPCSPARAASMAAFSAN